MSAYAERALKVAFSPVPLITGEGHFGALVSSGGQKLSGLGFSFRPTGAFCRQNLQAGSSNAHRLVPAYLFGASVTGPAATVLPRQAVSVQRRHFLIIDQIGPCGPGQER